MSGEEELFPLVCRSAVDLAGMSMAWVGIFDPESERIVPVVSYGAETDYLNHLNTSVRPGRSGNQGPSAAAYCSNDAVIIKDRVNKAGSALPAEHASDPQWGSSGSFPIQRNGKPFAVFSAYHGEREFFGDEVTNLFNELARDLTFALDNLDREKQRREAVEALRVSEQHFRAYFERSMFGMATTSPDRGWIEVNQALCDMLGYTEKELLATRWTDLIHPEDLEVGQAHYQQLIDGTVDERSVERRFIHKSGHAIDTHLALRAVRNTDQSFAYVVSLVEDISPRKMAERREQMRQDTLEQVAKGGSLDEILSQVIASAESILSNSMCSILLMDEEGKHLLSGAAPSLPEFFTKTISGVEIGLGVGSCGTAAFKGERVVVENIASHPYWENFKDLAASAGLGACWSEPIHSSSGKVLGTFAIYRKEPSAPDKQEILLIEKAANLVSIAIERTQAQEELHLASSIYENTAEALLVTDANNRIIALNPAFTRITGYTIEDLKGRDTSALHSGRHSADFYQAIWANVALKGFWQGEAWNRRKNGEAFPSWLTVSVIHNDKGDIQRHVIMGSDITDKVRTEELVWRQANYDFLTNLPNRYMLQDRLEQEIRASLSHGTLLALVLIDLDHFKDVNDSLGRPVGDQLLIEAAERISDCVRDSDTVARMGGDEFTVILPRLANTIDGEKVAEQIISALAEPYSIQSQSIYVQASVGITFCPNDASNVDQLISNADQAMYASKTSGRNRLSYFTQSLHDEARKRLSLINDMRSAIKNKQFELYFQPIVDLATGKVCNAEALIRWNHPERGMISPVEFIPLAEETGLIVGIGDWVFREAALHIKRWGELCNSGVQVSVNMSPVQFQSDALNIADWLDHLKSLELDPKHLSIEITEGLLLNASDNVKNKLLRFRDAGIQVAIDDFGVGYSALSYLKRFDIDYLKIDQSFIQNLETDQNDLVLSEAIVIMAHRLGLKVIAEGVETEAQRQLLLEIGCDYGQGYLFSRPLPVTAFEDFLMKTLKPN
ncbi:EAL domain-containing protein [uncultured Marinobacter sp.]|uniref:EAL domain-containing protein n=1 Tax=uncultured Marinobacter sp. TaxID=187379 RepID=UPI00263632A5|nr:EAL domain-containing protein [uncultured Marinobacter sp.]